MLRLAINGYGRIGRCVLRARYASPGYENLAVVGINEPHDFRTVHYLSCHDSVHGPFPGSVATQEEGGKGEVAGRSVGETGAVGEMEAVGEMDKVPALILNGDTVRVYRTTTPEQAPWPQLRPDLVLECSGSFSERAVAQRHLDRGAGRVLFSQPAEADVDCTVVYGVNHQQLTARHRIVSNASCTSNCVIPIIQVLHQALGIEAGFITSIHAAMNDQPLSDTYTSKDLRLARSAVYSMVPVHTRLAAGVARILPELEGRFQAQALRIPTVDVSAINLTLRVRRTTRVAQVNGLLEEAARTTLAGVLGYSEAPLVSRDFHQDSRSAVVDAGQTSVSGQKLVNVFAWFDNEWGFAHRMLDVARAWLEACD